MRCILHGIGDKANVEYVREITKYFDLVDCKDKHLVEVKNIKLSSFIESECNQLEEWKEDFHSQTV